LLESTNPKLFTSKPDATHWRYYQDEQPGTSRFVTHSQWHFIVKRIMYLLKMGRKASDIVSVLPDAVPSEVTRMRRRAAVGEEAATSVDGDDDEGDNYRRSVEDDQLHKMGEMESKAVAGSPSTAAPARRVHHQTRNPLPAPEKEQFVRDLKKVPSRISQVVRHDKKHFKQKVLERDRAALKTIAQRRVDALTSTAVPLGFKDRHFFSEPDPGNSSLTRREPRLFHAVSHSATRKSAPSKAVRGFKKYTDLNSGLATMEIADAFLQGEVGREMLNRPDSDYSMYASSRPGEVFGEGIADPSIAARMAAALKGRPINPDADRRYAPNTLYTNDIREYSRDEHIEGPTRPLNEPIKQSTHSNYGWKSQHERRVEQKMNDHAKSLYSAPGWKSAKGGWVADFGAEHTHAFYTGPELDYPLFHLSRSKASRSDEITRKSFEQQIAQQTVNLASAYSDRMREKALSRSKDGILDALVRRTSASLSGGRTDPIAGDDANAAQHVQLRGSEDTISVDSAVAGAGEGPSRHDYFHAETASSSED